MNDSTFTKIINKQLPAHIIYEDKSTLAFLDIHPISEGHTLVVPKKQVEFVWDLEIELYDDLMTSVKKVANRLKEVLPTKYVGSQIIGIDVPHAHVHLVPFNTVAEFRKVADMSQSADDIELTELAKKLAFN